MKKILTLTFVIALLLSACGQSAPASTPVPEVTEASINTSTPEATTTPEALATPETYLTPKQLLGKRIFDDTNLSEPRGQSCASCHDVQQAFTGNNGSRISAVSLGSRPETFGNRNAPTAMYAAFSPIFGFVAEPDDQGKIEYTPTGGQFWDGRATNLAEQAMKPLLNPLEMNNPSENAVIAKVRDAAYANLFRSVYGAHALDDVDTAYGHLVDAIAAFEETSRFHPFSSKFDDYLRGKATLDPLEERGFELFKDPEKGNCISCHVGDVNSHNPTDWLFTDFTYDNLGIPRNMQIPDNSDPTFFDLGLCKQEGVAAKAPPNFDVESLCGAFKVPTLRNVVLTAPYGHNGYFTTLRDMIRFYVTRDTNPELWYPTNAAGNVQKFNDLPAKYQANVNTAEVPYDRKLGEVPRLTDEEIDAVVAFLNTLTDR
jgi:cytochrome c peroxidase